MDMQARWATLPHGTRLTTIGLIGSAGAVGVGYLTSRNPFAEPMQLAVITRVVVVLTLVFTGLYAATRRFRARMGTLLVATGFYAVVWFLNGSADSLAFTVGALASGVAPIVLSALLLSHPRGRLPAGPARRLVHAAWWVVPPLWLALMCVTPRAPLSTPLLRCGVHCPHNVLFLGASPPVVVSVLRCLVLAAWLTLSCTTALLLVRRWRTGRPLLRSAVGPVIIAAVAIPVLFAGYLILQRTRFPGHQLVGPSYILVAIVVPLTILTGLARERLYVAAALTRFLAALTQTPTADPEMLMASVLGDPTLRIAYRRPQRGSYVALDGRAVAVPGDDREVTFIDRGRRPLAAVMHHPELRDHEPFIEAAAAIALMRLENAQLEADLRASAADLHASRIRLVEAAHEERRRIERDLHDTVQQQLVALRIKLGFASDTLDTDPNLAEGMLTRLEAEIDEVLGTLRNLARGIYPALLGERGLTAALSAAAQRLPIAVAVEASDIGRYPEDVEVAVYFCCLEALQNVVKHGGDAATATVRLTSTDGELGFEVRDSGAGFEPAALSAGSGLMNMTDRLEAIGGTLDLRSRPGAGTSVCGCVPARLLAEAAARA